MKYVCRLQIIICAQDDVIKFIESFVFDDWHWKGVQCLCENLLAFFIICLSENAHFGRCEETFALVLYSRTIFGHR